MRDMVPIVIVLCFPPSPRGFLSDTVGAHRPIVVSRRTLFEFFRDTLLTLGSDSIILQIATRS